MSRVLPMLWLVIAVLGLAMTIRALASRADLGSKVAVLLMTLAAAPGIAFGIETTLTPPGPAPHFATGWLVLLWLLIGPVLVVASALIEPFKRGDDAFLVTRIVNALSWLLSSLLIMSSS